MKDLDDSEDNVKNGDLVDNHETREAIISAEKAAAKVKLLPIN